MDNKNFPFNLFNNELIDSCSARLKEQEAENAKAQERAERMLVFLDGLTLQEVERTLWKLRELCNERSVVQVK
jgi:hypothetical protein